jgi:hypothetical protein
MPPFPIPIHINAPQPDVAIEFAECFDVLAARLEGSGLDETSLTAMIRSTLQSGFATGRTSLQGNSLTSAIANLFPTPPSQVSVAFVCSGIGHEVAGVWLTPLSFIAKTDAMLNALKVLPAGQLFAIQFTATTLREFIDAVWQLIATASVRIRGEIDPGFPEHHDCR